MDAKTVIDRVSTALLDKENVRWGRDALLHYLQDGAIIIADKRPDLAHEVTTINNDTGVIDLPDDCSQLISVNHVNYLSCQYINKERLEQNYPKWRAMIGEPSSWTRDELNETRFFLFPKPSTEIPIEYTYVKIPYIESEDDKIPLKNNMLPYLCDFMMYRAYSRDGHSSSNAARAATYYQAFMVGIGEKTQSDFALKEKVASRERKVSQ